MDTSADGITAPSAVYEIGGVRIDLGSRGFATAIADAHAAHRRPRCMCHFEGVEMYVARLGEGYIVKRMPDTGSHHAPGCPSYDPPAEASGLGQVLGSAITEDPATGETTLRLGFPLTKMPGRSQTPPTGSNGDSVITDGTKLSLRALLHFLWDQAELTRWHPAFAGKRNWATVRRHLLQAAEHKIAKGDDLRSRLYIPEIFSVDQRDAINARRIAQWAHAAASPGGPQQLMLMIAEVKEFVPARYGFKAVIKHIPDQALPIDEQVYRQLGRRFQAELSLWGSADDIHMVMVATFGVSGAGVPAVAEMSLMPVTEQWLPIEDSFECQLFERLVADKRSFIKGLRYNLRHDQCVATATLTDTSNGASLMFVVSPRVEEEAFVEGNGGVNPRGDGPVWVWKPASDPMPPFPATSLAATAGVPGSR